MRRPVDSIFLLVFGLVLCAIGLWLVSAGELKVPMRRGGYFVVSGGRLWLLACSPWMAGATLLLAGRRVGRTGRLGRDQVTTWEKLLFVGGMAVLVLALLTAPKVAA